MKRVLVVDDNESIRTLIRRMLKKLPVQVKEAEGWGASPLPARTRNVRSHRDGYHSAQDRWSDAGANSESEVSHAARHHDVRPVHRSARVLQVSPLSQEALRRGDARPLGQHRPWNCRKRRLAGGRSAVRRATDGRASGTDHCKQSLTIDLGLSKMTQQTVNERVTARKRTQVSTKVNTISCWGPLRFSFSNALIHNGLGLWHDRVRGLVPVLLARVRECQFIRSGNGLAADWTSPMQKKILIVEDDDDSRDLLMQSLERQLRTGDGYRRLRGDRTGGARVAGPDPDGSSSADNGRVADDTATQGGPTAQRHSGDRHDGTRPQRGRNEGPGGRLCRLREQADITQISRAARRAVDR